MEKMYFSTPSSTVQWIDHYLPIMVTIFAPPGSSTATEESYISSFNAS
jgi:hypothetical protein